ncbi:MAG: DUF3025 domain-containing protein [Betaproteobacteria bacterium]
MATDWDPDFLARSPMFEPLRIRGNALPKSRWPSLDDLQRMLDRGSVPPVSGSGARIGFVNQSRKTAAFEDKYEPRIFLTGAVQVRERNWHDLLNALVWATFPHAKAALNARHYRALLQQHAAGAPNRGREQDAMTLFDEGGLIVAARDRALLDLIAASEWKTLFWANRARVIADARFHLFGHALYEKALQPFTGITARALLFEVATGFFDATPEAQLAYLDAAAACRLADPQAVRSPWDLPPLPILGVPGWCAANGEAAYYDNEDHFRKRRAFLSR